jgi:hypothetical protein
MRLIAAPASQVRPARVGPGYQRKVALVGTGPTFKYAPWDDPSWEIWGHASAWNVMRRCDRWFDVHDESRWRERKSWHPDYQGWLARLSVPIYMQRRVRAIPASVRYPRERVLAEFPRYFTNQFAWMTALALMEGVTHLGAFGIHYDTASEYAAQRPCAEFWAGYAAGRGVQVVVPAESPLIHEPPVLYGYEDAAYHQWVRRWMTQRAPTAVALPAVVVQPASSSCPIPPLGPDAPEHMITARHDDFWMLRHQAPTSLGRQELTPHV